MTQQLPTIEDIGAVVRGGGCVVTTVRTPRHRSAGIVRVHIVPPSDREAARATLRQLVQDLTHLAARHLRGLQLPVPMDAARAA